ncbi:MAG: tRNA (guanosine(46)-N7)-methyltransferase TrmB [Bacilli bacterium]|nr:tRNA (guanosine(46)-N7)-methyltransferase TrmB [Bacilli bacterium]
MRLRNVKNKELILDSCDILIREPKDLKGKWKEYFGNNKPIYIEIGMGKGDFIIQNALKYPNINFIGIEKYDSVLVRAIEKLPDNISNLKFVRMDAKEIDEVFDKEVERLYLNFSDPWPKDRHYKRRLTSYVFLNKYDAIFSSKKEIHQKTDNRNLFEFSLVSLIENGYKIEDVCLDLHNSNRTNIIMSEYEKKFVAKNNTIYYLVAKK